MLPSWKLISCEAGIAQLRLNARALPDAAAARHASRSYSAPLALVAWHDAPIGVDLERVTSTDRSFGESICTPVELSAFGRQLDDDRFVISLWASKEALAKALADPLEIDPRRLESPISWEHRGPTLWRAHEFTPAPDHVAWVVWRVNPGEGGRSATGTG